MTEGSVFNDVFHPMCNLLLKKNSLFIKEQMPGVETIMLFVEAENEHSLGEVYSLAI